MSENSDFIDGRIETSFKQLPVNIIFVITFAIGFLSIAIGIFFGSPLLLTVLLPVSLVVGYAYLCTKTTRSDLSKTKIGDSCYFLGFGFTLSSLGLALISLSLEETGDMDMRAIIGGFGAALSTTLAGLGTRLWHTTLATSFRSSKEKIEEEIESAMKSFSLQLSMLVEEVNLSITDIGTTITDTNAELDKSYKRQMEKNIQTISGSVARFANRLDKVEVSKDLVVKPINQALSDMVSMLNKQNRRMMETQTKLVRIVEGLSKQIDKSNSLVDDYIDKFNINFKRVSDNHQKVFEDKTTNISKSLAASLDKIGKTKITLTNNIVEELNLLKNQLKSINSLTEANNTASGKINELNRESANLLGEASKKLPTVIDHFQGISQPANASSKNIKELVTSLGVFQKKISGAQTSLETFASTASSLTDKLNSTSESIDEASIQLSEDISSIYVGLARQLKELRSVDD